MPPLARPTKPRHALAPRGQHDLAQRRTAGEPAQAEREHRDEAPRSDHATDSTPGADRRPTPATAAGCDKLAEALRHGSTGAIAMRNKSTMPMGMVMRSK